MNNNFKKYLACILMEIVLSGCVSVHTKTTNFYVPEYKSTGLITVLPAKQELIDSLEFASYKAKIEKMLMQAGYTIASNPSEATYVAFVAYGIDNGKEDVSVTPVIGQTGGGYKSTSGTVYGSGGSASYYGSSYTMPTYGVVGITSSTDTTYTRAIALDIVDAQSLKDAHAKKIFESRAKSSGSCSVMAGVFDEILEAMFKGFPGENGKPTNSVVKSKGGC